MNRGEAGTLVAADDFDPSVAGPLRTREPTDAESVFETIFLEHYERVVGVLLRLTGNRAQAEELANEVFLRLSHKSTSWLLMNNIGGWLYKAATHAGIDALRASAHRTRYEQAAAQAMRMDERTKAGPLNDVLREEERARVRLALSLLKPAQAQLLLMRASGCSYKELANTLNIAVGSVGTMLNRAEAEFRKRYLKLSGNQEER